jgi:predicted amidophosphoribosyltransferase
MSQPAPESIVCPRCEAVLPREQTTCPTCVARAAGDVLDQNQDASPKAKGRYQAIGHHSPVERRRW